MIQMKDLRSVLIVSESEPFFTNIKSLLPTGEFSPVKHAKSGGEARRVMLEYDVDLLIVDSPLPDEHGLLFAEDFLQGSRGVLLVVKQDMYDSVADEAEEHGIVALPNPCPPQFYYMAVKMLSAMSFRLLKLEKEKRTLEEKMADIRVVNKAKWRLIETKGMSEAEAHRYILKRAMDTGKSNREVAEEILG